MESQLSACRSLRPGRNLWKALLLVIITLFLLVSCIVELAVQSRYGDITTLKHGFQNHEISGDLSKSVMHLVYWKRRAASFLAVGGPNQGPQRVGQSHRRDLGCLQLGFLSVWASFKLVFPS